MNQNVIFKADPNSIEPLKISPHKTSSGSSTANRGNVRKLKIVLKLISILHYKSFRLGREVAEAGLCLCNRRAAPLGPTRRCPPPTARPTSLRKRSPWTCPQRNPCTHPRAAPPSADTRIKIDIHVSFVVPEEVVNKRIMYPESVNVSSKCIFHHRTKIRAYYYGRKLRQTTNFSKEVVLLVSQFQFRKYLTFDKRVFKNWSKIAAAVEFLNFFLRGRRR